MKKVLLWGAGTAFKYFLSWIQKLEAKGDIKVEAIVDRAGGAGCLEGYPYISKEQISKFEYDKIIITAVEGKIITSIKKDAISVGIRENAMVSIAEYELQYAEQNEEYYNGLITGQLNALRKILSASDEEVTDYDWMVQTLKEYGMYPYELEEVTEPLKTFFGVLQLVDEFAHYCNYIATLKVESAIEIGVWMGRSSYFICALLSRNNPELKYVMVDICDKLDSYDRFKEVLPALDKRIPTTSEDYRGEAYDFVFIDGDHSYEGCMQNYLNIGQSAKQIVCFHDICGHKYDGFNGGTVRAWKEVCDMNHDKQKVVFSKYPDEWMGIGCVLM